MVEGMREYKIGEVFFFFLTEKMNRFFLSLLILIIEEANFM